MVVTARSYSSYSVPSSGVGFGARPSISKSSERPKSQTSASSSRPSPSPPRFGGERLLSNGSGGYYTVPKLTQSLPPAKLDLESLSCRSSPGGYIATKSPRPFSSTFPTMSSKAALLRRQRNLKRKVRPSKPLIKVAMEQVTHSPVVQTIQAQTRKLVDDMEERQRQLTAKRRISEALVGLRAASERSLSLRDALEHDNDDENQHHSHLRDVVGDVGLALFSPLDDDVFREGRNPHHIRKDSAETNIVTEELHDLSLLNFPVELQQEPLHVLHSCPRLLTSTMIRQLVDDALPTRVLAARWDRIYSLNRDGDAFITMLDRCRDYKDTLLVLQTTKGHLLGGYVAAPWNKGYAGSRHFYGNGESFLFASHPAANKQKDEQSDPPPLFIYKWTGSNLYSQICDVDHQQLAMGGGGAFGLIIQDNFSRGSTGRCSTFGNPSLVPREEDGIFKILALEVYGFSSSMATTTTSEHLSIETTSALSS